MSESLVSIIVPTYSVESYIERCIKSIQAQTYSNLEVIFVDDCTKDNSCSIIERYIQEDSRLKIVHHDVNKGLFQARITGVDAATGQFIMFVDADDSISVDWVRILVEKAESENADFVIGDFALEYPDGKKMYHSLDPILCRDLCLEGDDVLDEFMKQAGSYYGWHTVWNKIYSRKLWDEVIDTLRSFSEQSGHLIMTEDIAFSSALYTHAKKVVNAHNAFYFYYKGDESSTAKVTHYESFVKWIDDIKKVFEFFKSNLKSVSKYEKYQSRYLAWREMYGRIYWENLKKTDCDTRIRSKLEKEIMSFFGMKQGEGQRRSDYYMYTELTELNASFGWYEDIKRTISSDWTTHISFDIFDTLVVRPFFRPIDLFEFMDVPYSQVTGGSSQVWFSKIRVDSEARIRKICADSSPVVEEVTLDMIYDQIAEDYAIDPVVLNKLKELEKELEIKYCLLRKTGKELFDLAHYKKKKILIISDMYLDKTTVTKILEKNEFSDYTLYLSSERKVTKFTGNLYKLVFSEENITEPSRLCHIGDNWNADIVQPQNMGAHSYHLCKTTDMLTNSNPGIYSGELFKNVMYPKTAFVDANQGFWSFVGCRCIWALIANKIFDNPYVSFRKESDFNLDAYYLGYCALGMHMLALTNWVLEKESNSGNTVHYVARDGYLPKRFLDAYQEGNVRVSTNYLRVSRKALVVADMSETSDLYSIYRKLNVCTLTPNELVNTISCLLDQSSLNDLRACINERYKRNVDDKFKSQSDYESCLKYIIESYGKKMNFELKDEIFKSLFSKIVKNGDKVFDVGYGGRTEAALSHVLGYPVSSYYIHTNSDVANQRSEKYGFHIETFFDYKPSITGVMREHLMMEMGPSTIGYDYEKKELTPIFEDYSIDYPSYISTKIAQDAAIDFVRDINAIFGEDRDKLLVRNYDLSIPFEYYLHASKQSDRMIFGNLTFEDKLGMGKVFNAVEFWNDDLWRINGERKWLETSEKIVHDRSPVTIDTIAAMLERKFGSNHKMLSSITTWFLKNGYAFCEKLFWK